MKLFLSLFALAFSSTLTVAQCKLDAYSLGGGTLVRYPTLAQSANVGGEVVVSFDLDSEGNPTKVHVLSGHVLLASPTAEMVKSWKLQSEDREAVKSVKNCRAVFTYSILPPPKEPECNEPARPQILRVSFEGAARVQVAASPWITRFCDSFGPASH